MNNIPSAEQISSETLRIINQVCSSAEISSMEVAHAGYQAELFKIDINDKIFIIKKPKRYYILSFLFKYLVARESAIYSKLEGIKGIPKCFGLTKQGYLILEFIDGFTFRDCQHTLVGNDREVYFNNLLNIIIQVHERGVYHGDLSKKDNIMVGKNNQPFIVDFGIAIFNNNRSNILMHRFCNVIKQLDLNYWVKHKNGGKYVNLSMDDLIYYRPMKCRSLVRFLRQNIRRCRFNRCSK